MYIIDCLFYYANFLFSLYSSFPTDYTICEKYDCSPGNLDQCYHGYQLCPESKNGQKPYCVSQYEINEDLRLELLKKGCEYEELPSYNCYENQECHIDNPLEGNANEFFFCCCGNSLCNQNDTFTHPTRHVSYGKLYFTFDLPS